MEKKKQRKPKDFKKLDSNEKMLAAELKGKQPRATKKAWKKNQDPE